MINFIRRRVLYRRAMKLGAVFEAELAARYGEDVVRPGGVITVTPVWPQGTPDHLQWMPGHDPLEHVTIEQRW